MIKKVVCNVLPIIIGIQMNTYSMQSSIIDENNKLCIYEDVNSLTNKTNIEDAKYYKPEKNENNKRFGIGSARVIHKNKIKIDIMKIKDTKTKEEESRITKNKRICKSTKV